MNFSASMRRLLQLRRSLERQEEMRMAMVSARLHAVEAEQQSNHEGGQREYYAVVHGLAGETSGAELQSEGLRRGVEQERAERLRAQAARLQAEQARQRQLLLERTRERETLDTLQQHFRRVQQRQRLRREQAALDEGFLLIRTGPPGPKRGEH